MNKMRMLALTTSYPLRPGGSAGVFVQSLYRALSASCSIDVVCPAGLEQHPASRDDSGADVRIHAVRYAPRCWRTLAQESGGVVWSLRRAPWRAVWLPVMLLGLFWRCWRRAGDVELIHANWAICGVLAGWVGRLRGKPVVTTLRGSDVVRAAHSWLDRTVLRLAVRYSSGIVCVSQAMANQLREQFPHRAGDIRACLNGVDAAFFAIDPNTGDAAVLRVLAVGNLIPLKGFDVLIEALSRARCRERLRVTLVGSGPQRDALRELAIARGVSSCIAFAGQVPVADMPRYYSHADLLVLSSRSEGRPNVVAEALASGLPVISTDLDGVHGMVGDDDGWLVPVNDAVAMAAALDRAAVDRVDLHRRGARARDIARTRIGTWADTAGCYDATIQAILGGWKQRSSSCAE